MNTPLFIVLFTDNDIYYGKKDYFNSGWEEIPNKSIKKVFFRIPTGDFLVLSEYEKYGRFTEVTKIVSGQNVGKTQLEYFYILGKRNEKIIEYKINILTGNTEVKIYDEDSQYVKGLNKEIWK